ncbi:hypothetical protein FPV67DRAFT_1664101 [Lyophyllum atratum]|nr:hypothetical protein FPV67DRAFT_1664101 [Lyophyllum atratum]
MDDVARFRDAFVKHLSSRLSAPITAESEANADLRNLSTVSTKNRTRRRSDKQNSEHRALQVISRALLNPIYLSWDIERYAETAPAMRPQLFQHRELGHIDAPATIVDRSGIIVLWYLPNVLPRRVQDQLFGASALLNDLLNASVKESRLSSWRVAEDSYRYPALSEPTVMPGAVNFSSGWYGTGHSSKSSSLKPSLNLREFASAEEWLQEIAPAEIILNSILSITHPHLYDDASTALSKIREIPETQNIASCWPSVFTGISVIANRLTVPHTDRFSRACWYDSLASVGPFTAAYLELPDIGLHSTSVDVTATMPTTPNNESIEDFPSIEFMINMDHDMHGSQDNLQAGEELSCFDDDHRAEWEDHMTWLVTQLIDIMEDYGDLERLCLYCLPPGPPTPWTVWFLALPLFL